MITARTSTIERKWDEANNVNYFEILIKFYVDDVTPLNEDAILRFPDKFGKTEILEEISIIVKKRNDHFAAVSALNMAEGTVVT